MKKTYLPCLIMPVMIVASVVLLTSCGSNYSGKSRSSGKTAVMLVVTNDKDMWKGNIGNQIQEYFGIM